MPERLELDIKTAPDGRQVIYFPFMTVSDVHWGTRQSRAKRLAHMFEHTVSDQLYLVGDIIDGEYMKHKKSWKFGPEDPGQNWHRMGLGHVLRKAGETDWATGKKCEVTYLPGNHDVDIREQTSVYKSKDAEPYEFTDKKGTRRVLRHGQRYKHHNLCGKSIYGIHFEEQVHHEDPFGTRIRIEHGDMFDIVAFGKFLWLLYAVGDFAEGVLIGADKAYQHIRRFLSGPRGPITQEEEKEIARGSAAWGKWAVKTFTYNWLGVRKEICERLDGDNHAHALLYGHTHQQHLDFTLQGKTIINDGCNTEDGAQALVRDKNGVYALIKWHKDGLEIFKEFKFDPQTHRLVMINAENSFKSWQELGVSSFNGDPKPFEDEYTVKADRVIRLLYRLWPPKERRRMRMVAKLKRAAGKLVGIKVDVPSTGIIPLPPPIRAANQNGKQGIARPAA